MAAESLMLFITSAAFAAVYKHDIPIVAARNSGQVELVKALVLWAF